MRRPRSPFKPAPKRQALFFLLPTLPLCDRSSIMVSMNKLPVEKRVAVITALVEGCRIPSTGPMSGVAKNTIVKLLPEVGKAWCKDQHDTLKNLNCRRLQLDEIWSFCYAKAKNVPNEKQGEFGYGDVWTWVAIDAESKLVPSWLVASRDLCDAKLFVYDLAARLTNRVQITSDG